MEIRVVTLSSDLSLAKAFQQFSNRSEVGIQVLPAVAVERLEHYLQKHVIDFVIVDSRLEPPDSGWIEALRKRFPEGFGAGAGHFLKIDHSQTRDVRADLERGYTDVLAAPFDLPLVLQKMQMFFSRATFLKEDLLFKMTVDEPCEVTLEARLLEVSEFGVVLRVSHKYGIGDLVTVLSNVMSDQVGEQPRSVLGRVVESTPLAEMGMSDIRVVFVGLDKKDLSEIRLWIRRHYIEETHVQKKDSA